MPVQTVEQLDKKASALKAELAEKRESLEPSGVRAMRKRIRRALRKRNRLLAEEKRRAGTAKKTGAGDAAAEPQQEG